MKRLLTSMIALGMGLALFAPTTSTAEGKKKTKVIYKKYTELDFAGQAVQGKVRSPEVFYIFQRKRAEGHQILRTPDDFRYHHGLTLATLKRTLPQ